MIKTAVVVGASFAAGKSGGNIIASKLNVKNDGARLGIQVATGLASFWLLSIVVG